MIYLVKDKKMYDIVVGSILLAVGLLIFNNPFGTLKFFAAIMAWVILLWGLINLGSYRFMNKFKYNQPWLLTQGILNIAFAIIVFFCLGETVVFIMAVLGIYTIILSGLKIAQGFKLKNYKIYNWELNIVSGIIGIIFGIGLFIYPEIVPILLSLFLITMGALMLASSLFVK